MTVTKAKGLFLQEIDGRPAFEVYHQYLGIKADKNFFFNSLEFPILLKRGERILAATAIYVRPDGSIMTGTPMQEGETFQFGYGDITMILDQIPRLQRKIEQFAPEAIYVYSCLTRRFLLQEDVELELRPFEEIAPSAGFFTNGEFCDLGDQSAYLNTTIVLVALREGDAQQRQVLDKKHEKPLEFKDPFQRRHSRILSSFRYFLEAVTNELVQANVDLKKQLEEIKRLRGILPICASCKKIRDDKGYWNQLETYIRDHSDADFSHGLCPDCAKKLYPDFLKNV
jgi:hypothetical protein